MINGPKGVEGLRIHGTTNVLFNGSRFYAYSNGQMRCGLLVVQYTLHDQNPATAASASSQAATRRTFPALRRSRLGRSTKRSFTKCP